MKTINHKTDLSEVQSALNTFQQQISDQLKGFKDLLLDQQIDIQDELSKRIDLKANQFDLLEKLQKQEKVFISKFATIQSI